MSDQSVSPLALAELTDPVLFGMMVSCPLYGIAIAQAISYYRIYKEDRLFMKIFVGILIASDTAQAVCLIDATLTWYFNTQSILIFPKSCLASFYIAYITVSLVQSAYAWRVWHISGKRKFITGVILFCSLLQLVGGIGITTNLAVGRSVFTVYDRISSIFGSIELVSSMICDTLISISLVYFLNTHRRGFKRTQNLVDRLIIYSIGVGLVTSAFAAVNFITWYAMRQNFTFVAFHFLISHFYINSFLVTLNSRTKFQTGVQFITTSDAIDLDIFDTT